MELFCYRFCSGGGLNLDEEDAGGTSDDNDDDLGMELGGSEPDSDDLDALLEAKRKGGRLYNETYCLRGVIKR